MKKQHRGLSAMIDDRLEQKLVRIKIERLCRHLVCRRRRCRRRRRRRRQCLVTCCQF